MKKWAFDPKNGKKMIKYIMISHDTILSGQKQPRLVPNMLWNIQNHVGKYLKLPINGNHYPLTPFI